MTQKQEILKHLQENKTITQRQASRKYGIDRLAPRIHELRNAGHNIESKLVARKKKNGRTCNFSEYKLVQ